MRQVFDEIQLMEKVTQVAGNQNSVDDAAKWFRMFMNASGTIAHNNIHGKTYWAMAPDGSFYKKLGFTWETLIKQVSKIGKMEEFGWWLAARRAHEDYEYLAALDEELSTLDPVLDSARVTQIEEEITWLSGMLERNGITEMQARDAYLQAAAQYSQYGEMYDQLMHEQLNMYFVAGIISAEDFNKYSRVKGYAPFRRLIHDEFGTPEQDKKWSHSAFVRRKGGGQPIMNPLLASINNESLVTKKALRQIALNKLALQATPENNDFIQQVDLASSVDNKGKVSFPQEKTPGYFIARRDGTRKAYKIDVLLQEALESADYKDSHIVLQLARAASRLFVAGTTTFWLPFLYANIAMDWATASANTKTGFIPVISPAVELMTALVNKNSDERKFFNEYMFLAKTRQTFSGHDSQQFKSVESLNKFVKRSLMDKVVKGIDVTATVLSTPTTASEISTRATEYIRARKMGYDQVIALEMAARVSGSFGTYGKLGGHFGKELIKLFPYTNAQLQGLAQSVKSLATPLGRKRHAIVVATLVAAAAAPLAYVMIGMDDDDREKYLQQWSQMTPKELSQYIFIPIAGGDLLKIRMPEQFGFVASLVNMGIMNVSRELQYNFKATEFFDAATSWMPEQVKFWTGQKMFLSFIPQVIKPELEVITNKKTYPAVRDLETWDDRTKHIEFRYDNWTSEFSKWLSDNALKYLGLSPKQIDHLIGGHYGRTGQFVTGKPNRWSFESTFLRPQYFNAARQVVSFWEAKDENDMDVSLMRNQIKDFTGETHIRLEDLETYYIDVPESERRIKNPARVIERSELIKQTTELIKEFKVVDGDPAREKEAEQMRSEIFNNIYQILKK